MRVSRITMAGFRGAIRESAIAFDIAKPLVLIYGENGSGKSTITDAFDFVCNGSCGSLEGYSLGKQAKGFLPSLGSGPGNLSVALESQSATWVATLGKKGPTTSPTPGCPDARILRRKSILRLIEAQPKERYETLKSFIAVPTIEKSESTLREAARQAESELEECARALSQATVELEKLWQLEGARGGSAQAWAQVEAAKNLSVLETGMQELARIEEELTKLGDAARDLAAARKEYLQAAAARDELHAKQAAATAVHVTQGADTLKLLQDTQAYLSAHTLANCPVCEQGIDARRVADRLGARINAMREIIVAAEALKRLAVECQASERTVHGKEAILAMAHRSLLEGARNAAQLLLNKEKRIPWEEYQGLLRDDRPTEKKEEQALQFRDLIEPWRESYRATYVADQRSVNQHNAIKSLLETIGEKRSEALAGDALVKKLRAVLEIVSQERKEYVEGVLAQVSGEVEQLYGALHPEENLGKTRLYLKPNAIGSLEFDAAFQDIQDLPPQAYYSESHLDTLGICVFFALAKLFRTDKTILILDDVLTSVDGPHLDRFMALLRREVGSFAQVIVTTHYQPWRDRWAALSSPDIDVVDLGSWSMRDGIQSGC